MIFLLNGTGGSHRGVQIHRDGSLCPWGIYDGILDGFNKLYIWIICDYSLSGLRPPHWRGAKIIVIIFVEMRLNCA